MQIQNNTPQVNFKSSFISNKALKEVKTYAQEAGRAAELDEALKRIKDVKKYKFDLKQIYMRSLNVCKTEINYLVKGIKYKHVAVNSKETNTSASTLDMIIDLSKKGSPTYNKIFGE